MNGKNSREEILNAVAPPDRPPIKQHHQMMRFNKGNPFLGLESSQDRF